MPNLTPQSPLLQPVSWQGQEYFTSQYFHQQYLANSPHGGKYRQHKNFLQVIRAMPSYPELCATQGIAEVAWQEAQSLAENFSQLFKSIGYQPLTLLNAVAQLALIQHLEDETSRAMAMAVNTHAAQKVVRKAVGLVPDEIASRTLASQLDAAKLLGVPLHLAQQEAVKAVLSITGVDYRPMLALAPAQDHIAESEQMLEPTSLAKEFGWGDNQGRKMNLALATLGWQIRKVGGGWEATPAGKPYCALHAWVNTYSSKSEYNLKWNVHAARNALGLGLAVPHA